MARTKLDPSNVPLIVEEYPTGYKGLPFITYIQFRNSNVLAIIDNVHNKHIQCYVLDLCQPESVDEYRLLSIVTDWFTNHRHERPLSVHLNKHDLFPEAQNIYRSFNIEFITRLVGPLFTYPINEVAVIRRKRRKHAASTLRVVTAKKPKIRSR